MPDLSFLGNGGFDAKSVRPDEGVSALPVSDNNGHLVKIISTELKKTSTGGGMLVVTFEGCGEFSGLTKSEYLNIENANDKAKEIAFAKLSAICHCVGVYNVSNSDVLVGKELRIVVVADPTDDYPNGTRILKFLDTFGNTATNAGQAQQAAAPSGFNQQAQPAQQHAQPSPFGANQQAAQQPAQQAASPFGQQAAAPAGQAKSPWDKS